MTTSSAVVSQESNKGFLSLLASLARLPGFIYVMMRTRKMRGTLEALYWAAEKREQESKRGVHLPFPSLERNLAKETLATLKKFGPVGLWHFSPAMLLVLVISAEGVGEGRQSFHACGAVVPFFGFYRQNKNWELIVDRARLIVSCADALRKAAYDRELSKFMGAEYNYRWVSSFLPAKD